MCIRDSHMNSEPLTGRWSRLKKGAWWRPYQSSLKAHPLFFHSINRERIWRDKIPSGRRSTSVSVILSSIKWVRKRSSSGPNQNLLGYALLVLDSVRQGRSHSFICPPPNKNQGRHTRLLKAAIDGVTHSFIWVRVLTHTRLLKAAIDGVTHSFIWVRDFSLIHHMGEGHWATLTYWFPWPAGGPPTSGERLRTSRKSHEKTFQAKPRK